MQKIEKILITQSILFSIVLFFSCTNPEEPEYFPGNFKSQLDSDVDNAILKTDGTVWAWGSNLTGQLGNGNMRPSNKAAKVLNLKNIIAIDLLEGIGVGVDNIGNIWFWGKRIIWDDQESPVTVPKKISILPGAIQIEIMGSYLRLLKDDGSVWQLFWDHTNPTKFLQPLKIEEMTDIKMISHILALQKNGKLCSFPDMDWVPSERGGIQGKILDNIDFIQSMQMAYSIVLKKDSTVWTWGGNKSGCLGNGTFDDNPEPTKIDVLKEIISISANGSRCVALRQDGKVLFWGLIYLNSEGPFYQNYPRTIEELDGVAIIFASPVSELLFMKKNGTYGTYNLKTKEVKLISL